jgi:hypothetical protein
MRFLLLYRTSNKNVEAGVPPSAQEIDDMGKLMGEMGKAGVLLSTEGLRPSSEGTRVRLSGGKVTVSDGPFVDVKEIIAGYALIQVKSKKEAIEWTTRFLEVAGDGESEVRPLFESSDFGPSSTAVSA